MIRATALYILVATALLSFGWTNYFCTHGDPLARLVYRLLGPRARLRYAVGQRLLGASAPEVVGWAHGVHFTPFHETDWMKFVGDEADGLNSTRADNGGPRVRIVVGPAVGGSRGDQERMFVGRIPLGEAQTDKQIRAALSLIARGKPYVVNMIWGDSTRQRLRWLVPPLERTLGRLVCDFDVYIAGRALIPQLRMIMAVMIVWWRRWLLFPSSRFATWPLRLFLAFHRCGRSSHGPSRMPSACSAPPCWQAARTPALRIVGCAAWRRPRRLGFPSAALRLQRAELRLAL
jgi:hypothetical protein